MNKKNCIIQDLTNILVIELASLEFSFAYPAKFNFIS